MIGSPAVLAQKKAGTITVSDSGVGLTKEEMISLLGTIARSGSKAFVAEVKGADKAAADGNAGNAGKAATSSAAESIIGR